jgi:CheY-like chemotaxis protein
MEQREKTVPSVASGGRPRKTLLIVEADLWTRYSAAEYFRARGFRVLEAKNADEAITLLSCGKHADLVFSEDTPPEPAGTCLADWLARQHPALPMLIAGAGGHDPGGRLHCLSPRGFIAKPYLLSEVERQIVGLL